jgi:phenylacetic acid degradation operon negative regulatory protein
VFAKAEEWLNAALETADGPLPDVSESFYKRFGGLA